MRWNPPETLDELLAPYETNEQAWRSGAGYTFTIEGRDKPELLGRISIRLVHESLWDLGFWIHPLHQRQGYMTEAASALIEYGFLKLRASEIQAVHATWNIASKRVLERAGLRFIKHVPEGFQKNGQWIEEDLHSITLKQWEKSQRSASNQPSFA